MEKSKIASTLYTLLSLAFFITLLYYFSGRNAAVKDLLSLTSLTGQVGSVLPKLLVIVFLFFIFKLLYVFLIEIMLSGLRRDQLGKTHFLSIKKLIRFFWWLLYIVITISVLTGNIKAFISSLGLVGLGLTFALQKPILNFVGWLTIILKGVYNEGDRIKVGNITGDVKEIQIMNTVLFGILDNSNTRSYKIITIPNELVLTTNVENYNQDSNYIMDELSISITYESNFHKAIELLDTIATKHLKDNLRSYIKWKEGEKTKLLGLIRGFKHKLIKNENVAKKKQSQRDQIEDLEEEFKPKIRLEMADSALLLIAQFLTPYDQVKRNRTKINIAFLDAINNENDIEVAYPHIQLMYDDVHDVKGDEQKKKAHRK